MGNKESILLRVETLKSICHFSTSTSAIQNFIRAKPVKLQTGYNGAQVQTNKASLIHSQSNQ